MSPTKHQNALENHFTVKNIWTITAILAFTTVMLLLIHSTFNILLLILAGSLIAIYIRALTSIIQRLTKWKEGICVTLSIVATLLIVAALFWLIGAKVQTQATELLETLPETVTNAKAWLRDRSFGEYLLDEASSEKSLEKVQLFAKQFFQTTFGIFGDLYAILFIGIFFAISPQTYTKGFVQLIPAKNQDKAEALLDKLSEQLRKWLKGKLFSMFVILF